MAIKTVRVGKKKRKEQTETALRAAILATVASNDLAAGATLAEIVQEINAIRRRQHRILKRMFGEE